MTAKRKHHPRNNLKNQTPKAAPFLEHVYELRKRCLIAAVAIICGSLVTYVLRAVVIRLLLAPAAGEHFMYTTPGGGVDFLFRICLYGGIIVGIPVIIFQLVQFLNPLLEENLERLALRFGSLSALAAGIGIFFGYTFGLPSALQFLLQDMSSQQISATVTIQSYLSFVLAYLAGAALLLQLPLILLFINRVRPLQPRKLLGYERWVIAGGFIIGAILNPTPNVIDFLSFSLPLIITYQVGIVAVWIVNRKRHRALPRNFVDLRQEDVTRQRERYTTALQSSPLFVSGVNTMVQPSTPPRRNFQTTIDRRGNLA